MTLAALGPRESRFAAIGLLVLVLLVAYFLLLHWWFVAPLRQVGEDMTDLRVTQARYAAALAQKPALEKRIAALGAGQAASSAFLPEEDPNAASAGLMQRVVDVTGAHAQQGGCEVTQKMPLPETQSSSSEPYRRASVSISLRCGIEPLSAVLHDLESGTPYLFINDLSIYRNPVASQQNAQSALEVQFTLSGYVRPSRAAPSAAPALSNGAAAQEVGANAASAAGDAS